MLSGSVWVQLLGDSIRPSGFWFFFFLDRWRDAEQNFEIEAEFEVLPIERAVRLQQSSRVR